MTSALVNELGFIILDGMRLPLRVIKETGEVEFCDKDKRRSNERGTRYIRMDTQDFVTLLQNISECATI
jgi:hypothetical protein